jgi:hypothetical protein
MFVAAMGVLSATRTVRSRLYTHLIDHKVDGDAKEHN